MSQKMSARVTCPSCNSPFQAPVEQVLDVNADPSAKSRVINNLVNVAECPHCGYRGELKLPFLYHDPENELALIYMPMEAGRDDLARQQAIGKLTSAVMEDLPPEERKAYLLQPQVFLTLDNIRKKVLEAEGVTPEMLEEQKAKSNLLKRMIDAPSDGVLKAMIEENDSAIDADFFGLLAMNVEMAQAGGQMAVVQRLGALHDALLDLSSEGQAIKAQGEVADELRDEPTREKLLELLVQATDERIVELLVAIGRQLLDYSFFQAFTSRIDSTSDEEEKERLISLRADVLDIRDRIDAETQAVLKKRSELLQGILSSDDPGALMQRRASELDQLFLSVLEMNLERAQENGDVELAKALQSIKNMILRLMEQSLPPEVRFFNRLMAAEDDTEVDKLLQENRELATERLMQFMEQAKAGLQQEDQAEEDEEHLTMLMDKVKAIVSEEDVS